MKTKNEIVDRLYKAGHITLEEVLVLMEKDYIQTIHTPYVYTPQSYRPYEVYCGTTSHSSEIDEHSYLNGPDINEGLVKHK
jgi:hypothetical protein